MSLARSAKPTDKLIEARGLTKTYGRGVVAVENLDLTVRRGEVFGVMGPNGAGKTTTPRMLLGLIKPTVGHAVVAGAAPGSRQSLAKVGAMVESPPFWSTSRDVTTSDSWPDIAGCRTLVWRQFWTRSS